jgi:Iron-dependent Transcriptional regulator
MFCCVAPRRAFEMKLLHLFDVFPPPRKGLLAIAVVVDFALQKDNQLISSKAFAARHGVPPRHLEAVLQALVRGGILKGFRGPRGGYLLARERHGVTANDILCAEFRIGGESRASAFVEGEELKLQRANAAALGPCFSLWRYGL